MMNDALRAILIGAAATAATDIWATLRKRLLGVAPLGYALVGRWFAWLLRGHFRHDAITATRPVPRERMIGWICHYLTGVAFAAVLFAVWGYDWACRPTLGPALIVGLGSVAAPFFVMQPGMGMGIAASRAPHPARARLHSLATHAIFGLALYAAAWVGSASHAFGC